MTRETGILACVLTRDEAAHISDCLATLAWADERLVIDCGSLDGTTEIADKAGATVITRAWDGWAGQRNFGVAEAARRGYRWILFVDADERVTDLLAKEICAAVRSDPPRLPPFTGYWIPRQNIIVGRWIRHGGWDPDYQLRLFRTDCGRYDVTRPVHELVNLEGLAGSLTSRLVHYNYDTWHAVWQKQQRYAAIEAVARHTRRQRIRPHNFLLQPLREFWRRYVTLEAWRDGMHGLRLAVILAIAEALALSGHWRVASADPVSEHAPASLLSAERVSTAQAPDRSEQALAPATSGETVSPCEIAVVIVSYNVARLLGECLASIRVATAGMPTTVVHTIVIDNASTDDSVAVAMAAQRPHATSVHPHERNGSTGDRWDNVVGTALGASVTADQEQVNAPEKDPAPALITTIANPTNLGFGGACNVGLHLARRAGARLVLLLNPDARLEPGTLRQLMQAADTNPQAAIIGPAIYDVQGEPVPPRRRFPTLTDLLIESTPLDWRVGNRGWPIIGPAMARYRCVGLPDTVGNVDWISGACLMVRPEALAMVGDFNPAYFLYFEETDLARRLATSGWTCLYTPIPTVVHHGSGSASQNLWARDRHYYTSKIRYADAHLSRTAARVCQIGHVIVFGVEAVWQAFRGEPQLMARHLAVIGTVIRALDRE